HCDVVSFHYYPWYTSESPAQVVERIHGITRKSVWITEFSAKYDAQPLTGYTEQTQADWLSRFLSSIYGATIKPQVAIWYIFHAPSPTTEEQPQCIIDHDYREKPAYNVFKKLTELATVQTVFTGADPVGFMLTGNIYDDAAMGWICAHRSSPKVLFPKTDATRVLPTGQPTWSDYAHLFAVGGRFANPTTKYYEDSGLAPLKAVANSNGTFFILRGSTLKLNVRLSSITASNDYFVVQVITDGVHKVVVLWGISAPGTYASGIYFDNRYLDIGSLTCGWHIVRWQDLNGNGVPENPSEFTILASGT
nr:glycosyl hydrolase [Candidatus Njordarchaeum guaymaensis]